MSAKRMYSEVVPWNVFKGCEFQCVYCVPSFQAQAKRQKKNCMRCYRFEPHTHPERAHKLPKGKIIWPGSSGDIAFCRILFLDEVILSAITDHQDRTFYLQSKKPAIFSALFNYPMCVTFEMFSNLILLTTLETNRDEGYEKISKAPPPSIRARDFAAIPWPRKIITIEPIMDFDHTEFLGMIYAAKPEAVWIGYNSRPKTVHLPEPSLAKTQKLIRYLREAGIEVKEKLMREAVE
jgi:hypothetical protein